MKNEFRSIISFILVMVMMLSVVFSVPVTASAQETEAEVSDLAPEIECTDADAVVRYVQPEIEKEPESAKRDKDIAGTSADKDVAHTSNTFISGDWEYYLNSYYYDWNTREYLTVAEICGYTGTSATVNIPEKIDGYDVNTVEFGYFTDAVLAQLENIYLPVTVEDVYGLAYLPKLKSISVSEDNPYLVVKSGILYSKDMTELFYYPIYKKDTTFNVPSTVLIVHIECNKYLKKLVLSDVTYSAYIFSCPALTTFSIGEGLDELHCSGLPKLSSLTINPENNVFSVKDGVLYDKDYTYVEYYPEGKTSTTYTAPSTLENLQLNNKYLKKIKVSAKTEYVFLTDCTALTSLTLGNSVNYVDCYNLPALTSLKLTDYVDTLYLSECKALASLSIPKKLRKFTVYALPGLKSVTVSSANKYYYANDGVLFSKDKNKLLLYPAGKSGSSYTVPTSVTTISDRAFADNKYLKTVTMNKNVVTISYRAFANCSNLSTAALSKKLKTIGDAAFLDCPKLKTVSLPKSIKNIYNGSIGFVTSKTTYLPKKLSGFTTRGYKGTVAQTYAKNNGLKFTNITPSKVKVSVSKVTLGVGETYNLDEVITPSNKVDVVKWSTSNKSVVTVNSTGVIAAKKAGTATIKVTTSNNKTATCKVTVKKAPTKLSLNKMSATLKVKKQVNLNPKFYSGQYANKVTFKSSNTKIATVNATGVVTAKKKGTVTITAKTYNGKKCTCKITVK